MPTIAAKVLSFLFLNKTNNNIEKEKVLKMRELTTQIRKASEQNNVEEVRRLLDEMLKKATIEFIELRKKEDYFALRDLWWDISINKSSVLDLFKLTNNHVETRIYSVKFENLMDKIADITIITR